MTDHSVPPSRGAASPGEPYRASGAPAPPEPRPSRGRLHAMAIVRWVILAAVTALAAHTLWTLWGPSTHQHQDPSQAEYCCPMHPQIRSHEPGECPICHMRLEPVPMERRRAGGAGAPGTNVDAATVAGHGSTTAGAVGAMPSSDAGAAMPGMPGVLVTGAAPDAAANASPQAVVPVTVSLERQRLIGVTTAPATRGTLGQTLRVPGVVEAPENATAQVHVRAPGFLERVAVRETGVLVARGQVLAWFYSPQIYQIEQELLTAHRWATTRDAAAGQPSDMEIAARRNLELLGLLPGDIDAILRSGAPLRAVPVRAPASGYVTRFAGVPGMYATPETALYELADLTRVWIVASIYERDLGRVRPGMVAQFVTPGAQGPPLSARVALVEPEVSAATRTARVRLQVPNPGLRLRPGQYGDVAFDLPAASALTVPRDAVIDTGTQQYVFVDAGGGRFEPRRVRAGALVGDQTEVVDGLREGERVVVHGNFMLDSESRLQASLATTPAATGSGAGSAETGPDCETAFDRQRLPDRYTQCRACERMHRGMGSMEADCKNVIPRPWR